MSVRAAELEIVVTVNSSGAKSELASLEQQVRSGVGNFMVGSGLQNIGKGLFDFFTDNTMLGAKFEQQMVFVNRLIGGTIDNLEALKQKAVEVDMSTMFDALDVGSAMEQLAREGFTGAQIIGEKGFDGMIDSALDFAAAIDEDVVQSANIYGNVMRVFREEGLSSTEVADTLTASILRSGRGGAEWATGFQYVGAIAADLNIPLWDLSVTMAELEREGIKARSVGTGLRSMLLSLADPANQAELALRGITAFVDGEFVGLPSIIGQMHEQIKGMGKDQAIDFIGDLFGKPAASPLYALFAAGIEGFDETASSMEDVGSAGEMMDARMNTLAGSVDKLSSSWVTFKKQLGDSISQYVKPLIDGLVRLLNFFQATSSGVKTFISVLILLGGALAWVAGSLMLFHVIGGGAALALAMTQIAGLAGPVLVAVGVIALLGFAFLALRGYMDFGGAGSALMNFFSGLALVLKHVMDAFQSEDSIDNLMRSLFGGLAPLKGASENVQAFVRNILLMADAIGDLFRALKNDGLSGFFSVFNEEMGNFFSAGYDAGEILVRGTFKLLSNITGRFTDWLKGQLGMTTAAGDGTGGPDPSGSANSIPFGTLLIEGVVALGEGLKQHVGNLWGWVKGQLGYGDTMGDGTGGPDADKMTQILPVGTILVDGGLRLNGLLNKWQNNLWGWVNEQFGRSMTGEYDVASGTFGASNRLNIGEILVDGTIKLSLGLADIDNTISKELGLSRTPEQLETARKGGEESGAAVIASITQGVSDAFDKLGEDSGGGGGASGLWSGIKKVLVWEPEFARDEQATVIDEAMAWAQGLGAGMQDAIFSGISKAFNGSSEYDAASGTMGEAQGGLKQKMQDVWDGLKDAFSNPEGTWDAPKLPDWMSNPELSFPQFVTLLNFLHSTTDALKEAWEDLKFWQDGGPKPQAPKIGSDFGAAGSGGVTMGMEGGGFNGGFQPEGEQAKPVAIKYVASFDTSGVPPKLAGLFGGGAAPILSTTTAKYDADTSAAIRRDSDVRTQGREWDSAHFSATLDADNGPAAVKYTDAFGWGATWAGTTFTATFDINTLPLLAALEIVRAVTQEIADLLPHSPARKGPLSQPISFGYIADDLEKHMGRMGPAVKSGVSNAASHLIGGLTAASLPFNRSPRLAAGGGGTTVHMEAPQLHINAPVYGVDDLQHAVVGIFTDDIAPALQDVLRKR